MTSEGLSWGRALKSLWGALKFTLHPQDLGEADAGGRVLREPGPSGARGFPAACALPNSCPGPSSSPGLHEAPVPEQFWGTARLRAIQCSRPSALRPATHGSPQKQRGCFARPGTLKRLKRSFSLKNRPVSQEQDTWDVCARSHSHLVPAGPRPGAAALTRWPRPSARARWASQGAPPSHSAPLPGAVRLAVAVSTLRPSAQGQVHGSSPRNPWGSRGGPTARSFLAI